MFSFAKNFVKTLEHSADTIFTGGATDESIFENDSYFSQAKGQKNGFRVLSVKQNSVAESNGLNSWFDYIIGINGHEIPTNYTENYQLIPNYEYFLKEIENCKNRSIILEVWSAKGGQLRTVEIPINEATDNLDDIPLTPNPNLIVNQTFSKLGMSLQWTPIISASFVYHILEINANSPAEKSGLIEHSDYIIGAQDGLLATGGEDLLGRVITSKKNQQLILYVYNHDYDIVRPITIIPTDNWGGVGLLGCGVGAGLLHRLPAVSQSNVEPGSVLFDTKSYNTPNDLSQESFHQTQSTFTSSSNAQVLAAPSITPAFSAQQPGSTLIAPTPIHPSRKKRTNTKKAELLDFLTEESERSRRLDHQGRTIETSTNLPPPPK